MYCLSCIVCKHFLAMAQSSITERMPVILGDKESTDTWLFGSTSSKFETVLKPYEETDLVRAS